MKWALLAEVDPEQARTLLASARRRRFRRGDSVFHEGDLGDSVHLIDRGRVAVRVTTPAGDVATIRVMRDGQHFGDLAVMSEVRRSATITALETLETLELSGDVIRDFCDRHRSFERALAHVMANQLRSQSMLLLDALYLPAPRRLARRLVELCDVYDDGDIPLTQDDLAGLGGVTRQTVNQLLTEWRDAGTVEVARGRVRVVDRPGLERIAR
jgi:CRP/FNR family transcriptional regulator, cyclic AMP receptor protein